MAVDEASLFFLFRSHAEKSQPSNENLLAAFCSTQNKKIKCKCFTEIYWEIKAECLSIGKKSEIFSVQYLSFCAFFSLQVFNESLRLAFSFSAFSCPTNFSLSTTKCFFCFFFCPRRRPPSDIRQICFLVALSAPVGSTKRLRNVLTSCKLF